MAQDLTWREMTPTIAETWDFANCWTVMNPEGPIREMDLVAALFRTRANLYQCALLLQRKRSTISKFLERNIAIQEIRVEVFDQTLDQLESDVISSALGGDGQDRRFVLSTLGKDRGFSTRAQVTGPGDGPVQFEKIEWEIVDPKRNVDTPEPSNT